VKRFEEILKKVYFYALFELFLTSSHYFFLLNGKEQHKHLTKLLVLLISIIQYLFFRHSSLNTVSISCLKSYPHLVFNHWKWLKFKNLDMGVALRSP